tara:strand:- start:277 stop:384 length:108 start_codon:yes stop_codon:yes gene_type:complete
MIKFVEENTQLIDAQEQNVNKQLEAENKQHCSITF